MFHNIILNTDAYKPSHYLQLPPKTNYMSSYIEARGGFFNEVTLIGIQAFSKEYLSVPITMSMIDEAELIITRMGMPFNREGWEYILEVHDGFLPLEIRAVAEGTTVPIGNVLVQIVNTDRKVPWLTSYVEPPILRAIWYPTTICTLSRSARIIIASHMDETCDNRDGLDFKLHDFGSRGVSSDESAGLGGMAHLATGFKGTDNITAIQAVYRYYFTSESPGFSIPASEHSTVTSWGQDCEEAAYENMIEMFAGEGKIYACVSDSYDMMNAANNIWGGSLKQKVIDAKGTLVVRPDSGDARQMPIDVILALMDKFGFSINSKGYKLLPDCVRVIQGDGINVSDIGEILRRMTILKLSTDNITFGMGGGLLQSSQRDDCKWAMKCSAIEINGVWYDVFKDPITDLGKRSKKGRLALSFTKKNGYKTIRTDSLEAKNWMFMDKLEVVYLNGVIMNTSTFDEVRERANRGV